MSKTVSTVEGFRNPWTQGAHGYHEADTFAAALAGFKRKRTRVIFHMPNTGEAGTRKCVVCAGTLSAPAARREITQGRTTTITGGTDKPDRWSTWTYDPTRKAVGNGMHYGCSWSALMLKIFILADQM